MPTEESDWMHAAAPPPVLIVGYNARRIPKGRQTSRGLRVRHTRKLARKLARQLAEHYHGDIA